MNPAVRMLRKLLGIPAPRVDAEEALRIASMDISMPSRTGIGKAVSLYSNPGSKAFQAVLTEPRPGSNELGQLCWTRRVPTSCFSTLDEFWAACLFDFLENMASDTEFIHWGALAMPAAIDPSTYIRTRDRLSPSFDPEVIGVSLVIPDLAYRILNMPAFISGVGVGADRVEAFFWCIEDSSVRLFAHNPCEPSGMWDTDE